MGVPIDPFSNSGNNTTPKEVTAAVVAPIIPISLSFFPVTATANAPKTETPPHETKRKSPNSPSPSQPNPNQTRSTHRPTVPSHSGGAPTPPHPPTSTTTTTSSNPQPTPNATNTTTAMASPSPSSSSSSSSPSSSPPQHPNLNPNSNPNPPDPTPAATPTVALPPPAAIAPPPLSTRRVPPPCWSVEETVALIDSYQEKWYSLRRGNLKASHWEDVSNAVHRRCQNLPGSSPKTAVQCRHKVEKLRKRYRSEKQRSLRNNPNPRTPPTSSWVFFRKMEAMEAGSLPGAGGGAGGAGGGVASATARSTPRPPSPSEDESSDDMLDEEEEEDDYYDDNRRNYRSAHGLVTNGTGLRFKIPKAVRTKGGVSSRVDERPGVYPPSGARYHSANYGNRFSRRYPGMTRLGGSGMEEMRRRSEKKRSKEREEVTSGGAGGDMGDIVAAVRMLGDGFMRMEQMKMDMTREIHNLRMEMELKHTEMILDTQRRIVDAFVTGFAGKKRAKIGTES